MNTFDDMVKTILGSDYDMIATLMGIDTPSDLITEKVNENCVSQ